MTKFERFDVVDYIDNEDIVVEYITAAMEDPDPDTRLRAVSDVARPTKANISERDLAAIVDACENAPQPNAVLMNAAKTYCSRK